MLNERNLSKRNIYYMILFIGNVQNRQIYRESTFVIAYGWGVGKLEDDGYGGNKNILIWIVVLYAQL